MTHPQRTRAQPPRPATGLGLRECEALASFLQSPATGEHAMDLHMLQGLSVGLCLGPRMIAPALWLPWVWDHQHGAQQPSLKDLDHFNAALGWVMALYNEASRTAGAGRAGRRC